MMERIIKIGRFIENINSILGKISYLLILIEGAFIVFSVFMRYVLNRPFKSATDFSQIIMVYVAFLGCAFVLKIQGHIYVEIIVNLFRERIRNLIIGINYLIIGIPYCALLFYYSFFFVKSSYQITECTIGAGILIWPVKGTILLGFTMLAVQFLISGIKFIYQGVVKKDRNFGEDKIA